jgi:hypothetical protein
MAVTTKNAVFWGVTLCDSCKNRCFEERLDSIIRVTKRGELGKTLAVTSNQRTLRNISLGDKNLRARNNVSSN